MIEYKSSDEECLAEFIIELERIIKEGGERDIEDLLLGFIIPYEGEFPEELFVRILDAMQNPAFQKLDGSYHLLFFFESEWKKLTESQRGTLLDTIEKAYDKYSDWMAYFVISELLGEYYSNREALRVLRHLRETDNEEARKFVPHGFASSERLKR